jgi:hypothetical protein
MSGAGTIAACSDVICDVNEAEAGPGDRLRPASMEGRRGEVGSLLGLVTCNSTKQVLTDASDASSYLQDRRMSCGCLCRRYKDPDDHTTKSECVMIRHKDMPCV